MEIVHEYREINISLFASAARPKWWKRLYKSLVGNKCQWEIVFVGPNKPDFDLPLNFRYYKCDFKPGQCYAAASYFCQGELIGPIADDCVFDNNSLDKIWEAYDSKKFHPQENNDNRIIFTPSTIENGKDVTEEHYFFRHCKDTPRVAPTGFMKSAWFWKLGGIDRNFICGQYENLISLDALANHGIIQMVPESKIYINHEQVHGGFWNKAKYRLYKNSFRTGYYSDRRYLEECWIKEGFGTYDEKTLKHGTVSPVRLLAHQGFNYSNILTTPQGPQGRFGKK